MRENYIITLDSCNLFFKKSIEHRIEHVVDSIYGVFIHYTFLNFTEDLMNTLQFRQMMNLTIC